MTDEPELPPGRTPEPAPGGEPELPLAGLDAERPLPPELRARLEAALLAAVAGGLPVPADADALDAPRPLPEALRARLESALLAEAASPAAASGFPAAASPAASSAVAASPAAASAVAAGTAAAAAPPAAGTSSSSATAGAPSSTFAAGAEAAGAVTSLESRRGRKVVAAWSAVAAVLLLVVAVAGLLGRSGSGSHHIEAAGPTSTTVTPASLPSGAGVTVESAPPATVAPAAPGAATATTRATRPPRPIPSSVAGPGAGGSPAPTSPKVANPGPGGSQGAPAGGSPDPGPAPPFYNSPSPGASSPAPAAASPAPPNGSAPSQGSQDGAAPQTQKAATPAPAGPPLRIGIVTGDPAQEAGFRAYVDRLNQSGGVRGHALELVPVGPSSPAANTIATVNLSTQPVAGPGGPPSWATGPLLETLTATESLLAGNGSVFDFASPPERQGHLAADALFPSSVTGVVKAVVYAAAGSGPLHDVVPAAIQSVLEQRGVKVTVVTYDPNAKKPLFPADAAFLSLDPTAAKAWVAQAKAESYRPARGVAGIYSLADETLLPDLPEGARVVSPYVVPGGDEGQAIRSGAGGTSAPVLHGWATAKSLAAAIWRTGADTPAGVKTALEGLAGWSSGLAPPYETRPRTRSRTPEGVVFQVQSGAFTTDGQFRRDPF